MAEVPVWMHLDGDEDGGVALYCNHPAHGSRWKTAIVYYGWSPPKDLPVVETLAELVAAIFQHAESHPEDDRG